MSAVSPDAGALPAWLAASEAADVGVAGSMEATAASDGLVRRAMQGDGEAFGELIDRHERAALAVAYATTRDPNLAADAVQDACLKAWHKRSSLQDPQRFAGWLMNIVRRCAIDLVRRSRSTSPLEWVNEPASNAGPDVGMVRRELDDRVARALHELDDESRLAVVMRYYDNAPARQIAQVLGCSPAAVDMRLKRARDRLRTILGDLSESEANPGAHA